MPESFEKISPTARMTAFMRQYSDIPYAGDVAKHLHAGSFVGELASKLPGLKKAMWFAPLLEIRYKSIAQVILNSGVHQVLELASGLALRGLAMTRDANLVYVETDLPGMAKEKEKLVEKIRKKYQLPAQPNLHLDIANALNVAELGQATAVFDKDQPVAVVTEGLLMYLTLEELGQVAENVRVILQQYGGFWVTSDFAVSEEMNGFTPEHVKFRESIRKLTGRDLYSNAFKDDDALTAFLDEAGFTIEVIPQVGVVPALSSLEKLDEPSQRMWGMISPRLKLWVLRLKA